MSDGVCSFKRGVMCRLHMKYGKGSIRIKKCHKKWKQAGAELGQAQLKLGLGFTSTLDS